MRLYDNDAYREEFMELVYDLLRDDGTNDRANQIIAAFDSAPEVEAEPLQPNDPLTLEELREMDGEPVWLRGTGLNRWYIFNGFSLDGIPHFMPEIGWKPWAAYRRRPEEEIT